jgi:site-specific DNA recombinase
MRKSTRRQTEMKPRAVGYIRVSSEEQTEGYSLAAQERALGLYCEAHGWELVGIYADEGVSAWTDDLDKRPQFTTVMTDAEAGVYDILVVHKLDRFARNVGVAVEALKTLRSLDVGFVSISEQMDFTTPFGKVALTMLLAFAEFYSDNLSAETR